MSLTSWFLVSGGGTRHRLPREMIFVGRDDCELMLQSRSVDKQHAVINYETTTDEHKVKDLGSLNGTFVNDVRIQEQMYVTLKIDDKLRFGYDTNLFTVVRAELHVPEEALKVRQRIEHPVKSKHEKFSSQLQLSQKKVPERETSRKVEVRQSEAAAPTSEVPNASKPPEAGKGEDKTTGDAVHRGTPLYGQPAWWGDGEMDQQHPGRQDARRQEKAEIDGKEPKKIAEAPKHGTVGQDPSYFEIPTKGEKAKAAGDGPSRDAEPDAGAEPAHGHASFTIEFDPGALGKVTVKDHVVKVAPETRPRPKRGVGEELSPLQTAMVAAEVKVADWLAQNELPLALKEAVADEDGESVKSDVPVHLRSLKGSKHEDGTQSDSENALGEQRRAAVHEERARGLWGGSGMKIREGRANVPEGLFVEEDSPARRQRFPASRVATFEGEVGGRRRSSAPYQHAARDEGYHHGDDHSDRVTYTIEIENGDHEEEEARRMIDRVFGVEEQHSASVSRLGGDDLPRDRLTYQRSGPGDRGKPGRMETEVLSEELVVGGPRWVSQWATLAASHIRTDPEGSGGETHTFVTEDRAEVSESSHSASLASSGYTERKRRTLPQLPCDDFALGRRAPGSGLRTDMGEKQDTELQEKENHKARGKGRAIQGSQGESPKRCSPAKSLDSGGGKGGHVGVMAKPPPRPLSSSEKRLEEARRRKREEEKAKENSGKPLLRQESFTVERPSSNVPIELIPRIDRHTEYRIQALDSTTLQKDSEAVAAFLETTVSDQGDPPSQSLEGSMSPESDVDTTSTVSQADGGRKVVQKRQTFVSQQKERAAAGSSGKGPSAARETHDKRVRTRAPAPQKPSQPWTSLDLTDDDVNSNSLLSDSQPTSIRASKGSRAQPVTVAASTKSSRAKVAQAAASSATTASKNTAVPRTSGPRPTRASLLRRARMGDSSDTEPADFDRMSVASEASTASSASRTGMVRRGMSRIEALAQPRRPRVGSPSAQSDSEAVTRSRGAGARSVAGDYAVRQGLRGSSVTSGVGPRARANSASKLSDKSKGTTPYGQVTPASNTRWRRVPVEYASTSEDEYGSNRHTSRHPSHTRPFPSTRVAQLGGSAPVTPSPGGPGSLRQNSREQDEYMKDWTAHSEEIARISQDLAKDLAMLAREIHDVAGEIDSVSPAASDPAVLLEEHVLDDSRSMEHSSTLESNGRQVELRSRGSTEQGSRSIRRQTWNRDDVVLDSLIFASVTQLSARIRQSVDKTANKIRILFKDKERRWDEVETKLQAEHDSLLLKSSNKEMSTILHDLKGVERQLLAIDIMLDPDGTLDALSDLGLTSPLVSEQGVGPGALQGAAGLLRASPGLSHANGASAEPRAALEAAERDPGLHADLGSASGEGQRAGPRN